MYCALSSWENSLSKIQDKKAHETGKRLTNVNKYETLQIRRFAGENPEWKRRWTRAPLVLHPLWHRGAQTPSFSSSLCRTLRQSVYRIPYSYCPAMSYCPDGARFLNCCHAFKKCQLFAEWWQLSVPVSPYFTLLMHKSKWMSLSLSPFTIYKLKTPSVLHVRTRYRNKLPANMPAE